MELTGLSDREVKERRERGEGEHGMEPVTKSRGQIVRENVFTLFNFLNFLIAALLFAVGAYSNMLFIGIIILNILIGIGQEWKAKKLVDELSILNRPEICVKRDGKEQRIRLEEVVKDDLLVLESGNQICNDAIVVEGMLEVNESLLTGESDGVVKEAGGRLLSGSSVIAGKAFARVIHVGKENYASQLVNEVKKEKKVQSELVGSMRKVTHFTSYLILPLGILLFLEAFFLRQTPVNEAVVSSAAALLGMLPKGLVLLISVSLAAGVIRLAKMKILVQNIYSLETLAHVDTLCLDKTGTITDGNLKVHSVIPMTDLPRGEVDYDRICEEYAVFARVTPKQKQELVKDLKRQGHQVAMTGDGVNDLLALREADCSIAVADGSDASRQISQIVLLNSDFTNLPQVVMEGRKVIHNVTRTAQVFFIKTIYSVLVSLFCLITNQSFPFIPIQITLVDACIEAYPSFLTISAADSDFYDCSAEKLSAVYTASSIYLCHYDRRNVWGIGGASFSV